MSSPLNAFFSPRGVVIVGVSTSPEKLGHGAARSLVESGYPGAIHFVGQKPGQLFDRPIHTGLDQIPDPVDLAVLIVPPLSAVQILEACGQRGIHSVILVSAGFREAGPKGAALEAACLEAARRHGIRMLGPNCIGVLDTNLPLDTTFLPPPMPERGGIGFISHSGAFCAAIVDWARGQGFGFSRMVSLGNQADVNETDMLPLLAEDEHTRVIAMYLEGVSDGQRFVQSAHQAVRTKPVIALKAGRFESGRKAAASHTGALAGSDTAFEAAFCKAGILHASSAAQMFDWARALESCPLPPGRRVAVLTNAGGPGVIAADALEQEGLILASLSPDTREALKALLPPAASLNNPVDMLASASPAQFSQCLALLLQDEKVDALLLLLPPPPMFTAEDVAREVIPVIQGSPKPVLVCLMGSMQIRKADSLFKTASIPTYPFPENAASALAALSRRAKMLKSEPLLTSAKTWMGNSSSAAFPSTAEELVAFYGIPTASGQFARSPEEAASLAAGMGFPVVMKIASPDIPHKSDIGGVLLDLKDQAEVAAAYEKIMENARISRPGARLEGVNIQRQVLAGQEVIIGMVRDPLFGPLMMFGSGGVEVEGLNDVAFALAPLSEGEAREMLRGTWAGRKLSGFRNLPPVDSEAVVDALLKLSRLAWEHEEIRELEINPLRALAQGAVALDVRMENAAP